MGCGCGSGRRHSNRPTIGPRPAARQPRVPRRRQLTALAAQKSSSARDVVEKKRQNAIAERLNKRVR
jgi:hypothetical protein